MRIHPVCLALALLVPQSNAQTLPELGDSSGAVLSPHLERKIGEQAMREIRSRDRRFLDDPELTEYVNESVDASWRRVPMRARTSSSS